MKNQKNTDGTKGLIAIAVIVIIIMTCSKKDDTAPSSTTQTVTETPAQPVKQEDTTIYYAHEINADYQANEITADDKYKDKTIYFAGKVNGINKNVWGTPYVGLATGDMFESVQCDILKEDAARLHKGNVVVLKGKCTGMLMHMVHFDDCSIYEIVK